MILSPEDLWITATCATCAAACAVPGVFLMLRRSSMLGDAVSHAILPGLAGAFMITGTRAAGVMLIGALVAGLCTAFLSSFLHRSTKIASDASLGIVFTTFFAIGVILINWVARQVDLDPGCVLYGLVEFSPFDTLSIAGYDIPRSFVMLSGVLVLNTALASIFFKELRLTTFDPDLARSLGYSPALINYGLMACVTVTAVASFEAVGSILVVSMLITPAAAAYLLSDRLAAIIVIAGLLGILSACTGYLGALTINTSVAGMMSVAACGIFTAAAVFSPKHGQLVKLFRRTQLRFRIVRDDILGFLFRWHEVVGSTERKPLSRSEVVKAIGSGPVTLAALYSLKRSGDVVKTGDGSLRLTERGLVDGAALIRSHRLWESYLAKHLGLPLDHLHAPSERTEHFIGRALAREIEAEVGAGHDPHGRDIPK